MHRRPRARTRAACGLAHVGHTITASTIGDEAAAMRAAIYDEQRRLVIQDKPVPEPEPGWVRLRIGAVGICGTDLHMFHGKLGRVAGLQPGHEVAGHVDAVGDGVTLSADGLQLGGLVALEPITACGQCRHCLEGQYNRCHSQRLFGVTRKGGMAEYLTVPAERLFPVDAGIGCNVAALAEPLAVCARGVAMAELAPKSQVAILGAGTIGLMSIVAAQAAGAAGVHITARHPHQRALASSLGAQVHDSSEAMLAALGEDAVDVVIETVGGEAKTLTEAVNLVRRGGRIVMLGVFEGAPRIPGLSFSTKELTLVGSNCYSNSHGHSDFGTGVQLLNANAARIAPLVTHTYGLADINTAFATAADKASGSIKVQVEPQR